MDFDCKGDGRRGPSERPDKNSPDLVTVMDKYKNIKQVLLGQGVVGGGGGAVVTSGHFLMESSHSGE